MSFSRQAGRLSAKEGSWTPLPDGGGVRLDLHCSVRWTRVQLNHGQRSSLLTGTAQGRPRSRLGLEPDSQGDACRLLQGLLPISLLPGPGTVLGDTAIMPLPLVEVSSLLHSVQDGEARAGRRGWAAEWAEFLPISQPEDMPPTPTSRPADYSQLGDVSASWPASTFPPCQDFQEHSWDG